MAVVRCRKEIARLLVYLVESPEHGPGHRVFDDEDILVGGGVRAIESQLEKENDRFLRLGVIEAEKDCDRISYTDEDLLVLPEPLEGQWQIGRTSPAYGRSALEREIFESQDRAAKRLLATWQHTDEDGDCIAYVPQKVRGGCLASLASSLCAVGETFDKIEITAIKYWYGKDWQVKIPTEELILAEFSLVVPVRIRWSQGAHLIISDIGPVYSC
jgi:hypothetical protein